MTFFTPARLAQAGAVLAATLLAAGAAAPLQAAAPGENATAATQQREAAQSDRRICVRMEMPNTRLPRRVCKTAAEWDREGGVPAN